MKATISRAAVLMLACSCKHLGEYSTFGIGSVGPAGAAMAGVTSAALSVALGGCVADCPTGSVCDHAAGLCRVLPCRGACREDEVCDAISDRCAPKATVDLRIETRR